MTNKQRLTLASFLAYFVMSGMLAPMGIISGAMAEYFGLPVTDITARFSWLTLGVLVGAIAALVVFDWVFRWVNPLVYRRLVVIGSGTDLAEISASLRKVLAGNKIRIQDLAGRIDPVAQTCEIDTFIRCRNLHQAPELLTQIGALKGITSVEWTQIAS